MAGLPWIQAHVDLPRHPKSIRLAACLEEPRAWTWVVQLWFWAAEYQPEGRIECPDAELIIAKGSGWAGSPEDFVRHLVAVGFLDRTPAGYEIHDWEQYAGAHIEKRRKDADRKRRSRGGHKDVRVTSGGGRDESAREREMERENETTTLPLPGRSEGAADRAAILAGQTTTDDLPRTMEVLKALHLAGKAAACPAKEARTRRRDESLIAEVGVSVAVQRILAAWSPARTSLGWYADAIAGPNAKKPGQPPRRGMAPPSTDFTSPEATTL